jgi:ribosomal protein L11 methyltransferase
VSADSLWRVTVQTSAEAEDAVGALLESWFGQTASSYTDVETRTVTCTVFLQTPPKKSAIRNGLSRIRECGLDPGQGRVSLRRVRKQEWSESWKRHFKPFTVGGVLLVKPSWSRRKPARGQAMVILDPGLSFGTGQHPTTRFCLDQLAEARKPHLRQSFLDVGTGSGILAIAAAKLGYTPARAFDFDPAAVRIAKDNARTNRVRVAIKRADITKIAVGSTKYDVVCANLIADLLESCAPKLQRFLKPGGLLVLAGILGAQIDGVRKTFEKRGFRTTASHAEGEWESLALAHR